MAIKNPTVAVVALIAVLAAGYPASSWYLGRKIEAAHAETDARIAALPYLKLIRHDYERHLFDASEVITLEIPAAMLRLALQPDAHTGAPAAAPENPQQDQPPTPAADLPLLRFTIRSAIQHGPLPGLTTLAAGSSRTEIEFEEPIRQKVIEAFGGKPAVEIRTIYNFLGGGRSTISSPPFKVVVPGNSANSQAILSGDGLELRAEFARGMERYTLSGSAPRFEFSGPNGARVIASGLAIENRQQRVFPDEPMLYSGSQQFGLAELSVDPGPDAAQGKAEKLLLKDIRYDVQVPVSGEFIDMIARIGATAFQIGEQEYGPANYDFSVKHLNARKLMNFNRAMMAIYAKPEALQDRSQLPAIVAAMRTHIVELLLDNPVVSVDRINFRTQGAEAKLSASVRLPEAKAEDFANPMLVLAKLDAAADVALPVSLVATIAGGKNENEEEAQLRKKNVEQSIDGFVRQGYATVDNGVIKSNMTFKAGQLLVNGKPFNPMAMAQPQQQPPEQ